MTKARIMVCLAVGFHDVNNEVQNLKKNIIPSSYYFLNILSAQVASIVMSLFNTLGAVVANFLIDRIGRRKLLLVCLSLNSSIYVFSTFIKR